MNYRIDLENAHVRSLAEIDDLDALVAADQVYPLPSSFEIRLVDYETSS